MNHFDRAFRATSELVANFRQHEADYLAAAYSEAQVRKDFVDKFFHALGWDVYHETQKNPYAQEVKIEAPVNTGGQQRRADYAFFIAPELRDHKFLCEAKKPFGSLRNRDNYFQAIRYSWNRQTPFAVLFNFRELHLIDSRYKPDIATVLEVWHRVYRYTDFSEQTVFSELYFLLGRDAVAGGAITDFAKNIMPQPKGKATQKSLFKNGYQAVDVALLEELDTYRLTLANAFHAANPWLDGETLTEAVQRTFDRLVFMRFLEDKQIEVPAVRNFGDKGATWQQFIARCRALDERYNRILFKPSLIDDPQQFAAPADFEFKQITDYLSDNTSPYDFDSIPISILGSIYERFLGKVVAVTAQRADVTEKPEVRKAGGVYYTPEYIVRYIVRETVGRLIQNKTPDAIAQMCFADIACGSGSFLIEVYTLLLEQHTRYYCEHPDKAKKGDTELKDGTLVLSLKKRRDILQNNIFGVDIDFQAVEVSQLSLYLKMLEATTPAQCFMFPKDYKERILPDLARNVICGNSLVQKDYWGMLNEEQNTPQDRRKINAIEFETAFPAVMQRGGFDAVVGNPPYVRQEILGNVFKQYAKQKYCTFAKTADLFVYFIEQGVSLLKVGGQYGVIVANKWMRANYGKPLRVWLKNTATHQLAEITDFGDLPVFQGATTYPCILRLSKTNKGNNKFFAAEVKTLDYTDLGEYVAAQRFVMKLSDLDDSGWTLVNSVQRKLLQKILAAGIPLGEYVKGKIYYGIKTGLNEAFVIDAATRESLIAEDANSAELIKPFLAGRNIKRYELPEAEKYLISIPNGWTRHRRTAAKQAESTAWFWFKQAYPAIAKHLCSFEAAAKNRCDQGEYWWELRSCDYYGEFEKPKIIIPAIVQSASCTFDRKGFYSNDKTTIIPVNDLYLLALLNSKTLNFVMKNISSTKQGGYFEYKPMYIAQLPIPQLDLTNESEKAMHDQLVQCVTEILKLKREFDETQLRYRKTQLDSEIRAVDDQIDALVYTLYGITEQDMALIASV